MLLDRNDEDWHDTVLRIIEWSCQHWGGGYFILIPTDGNTISPLFWSVLDAYDPDYVYSYCKTLLDWKVAKPDKFNEWLDRQVQAFSQANPDSDPRLSRKAFEDQAGHVPLDNFAIGTELKRELKHRLVPFHQDDYVIQGSVFAGAGPGNLLTSLSLLLPECDHPSIVTTVVPPQDSFLRLIVAAMAGSVGADFLQKLKALRVSESSLTVDTGNMSVLSDLVLDQSVKGALVPNLPFWFSMLALGYYQKAGFRDWLAPVFVVVGSTLEDFCLFYSLSRLRGEAIWMPDEFLRGISPQGQGLPADVFDQLGTSFLYSIVNKVYTRVRFEKPNAKVVLASRVAHTSHILRCVRKRVARGYETRKAHDEIKCSSRLPTDHRPN